MGKFCTKCRSPLEIIQGVYIRKIWSKTKRVSFYTKNEVCLPAVPVCLTCGEPVSAAELSKIGLKNIHPFRNYAQGSNFFNVYKTSPDVYEKFSFAEDVNQFIATLIKKKCKKKYRILDIGSGTGKYARILSPVCSMYFALEPSEALIDFSKHKADLENIGNIVHIQGVAEHLPFPKESIDLIICTWASFVLNDSFREMLRVLKRGGEVIRVGARTRDQLTSLFKDFNQNILDDTNRWYKKMGFTSEEREITIKFRSLMEAKSVLSEIFGDSAKLLQTPTLQHKVVINTFKKK